MEWRLLVASAFLAILLACILWLAYRVIPSKKALPDTNLPPSIQVPLYGQVPPAVWTKMPWGEEVRVSPKIPLYPQLEVDSSGNLLYPFE
jgi:hypothetical protein